MSFVISCVCALDNTTNDVVCIEKTDLISIDGATDDNVENNNAQIGEFNSSYKTSKEPEVVSCSVEGEDILMDSPPSDVYKITVNDVIINYGSNAYINVVVNPASSSYNYGHDFYLKIFDLDNNVKINKHYRGNNSDFIATVKIASYTLDPGVYTIKIINYNDNYLMADAKLTIKSVPYTSYSVSVSDTTIKYESNGNIVMSISPASDNSYIYRYDFYLKVYDSENNVKISKRYNSSHYESSQKYFIGRKTLDPGVYTIKILNNVDNHVMSTAKLDIKSLPHNVYSVTVYNTNINYGSSGSIDMSISPSHNNAYTSKYDFYLKVFDSENNIKISHRYCGDYQYSKSYKIESKSLNPGVYSIKIINTYDNEVMETAKLTIKSPTYYNAYSVRVQNTSITYGFAGSIKMSISSASTASYIYAYDYYLYVYDSENNVKISKKYYNTTSRGFESYSIPSISWDPGVYSIKIINSYDNHVMGTAKLTIKDLIIETQNVSGYCDEIFAYKVRVSEDYKYQSGLNISFIFDNKKYSSITDGDGYATFKIHLKSGIYPITIKYGDIIKRDNITIKQKYVINKYKNVKINAPSAFYKQNKKLYYSFEGNLKGYFKIFKGNSLIYNKKLDTSGYIDDYFSYAKHSYSYAINKLKEVGTYTAKIIDSTGKVAVQSTFKIVKAPTISISDDFSTQMGAKETIYLHVFDKDWNEADIGGTAKFKINGKTYTAKVKNSLAQVKVKLPSKAKTYKCTAKYLGDKHYKGSSEKFTITVKKASTNKKTTVKRNNIFNSKTTTIKSVTLTPGAKYTLKVNVKYTNGKKINLGSVKVKVNGKTYTAKVSNGVAKVKITAPSKAGTYSYKATYNGNNQIKSSSYNFKVIVQKDKVIVQKYVDIIVKAKFNNYIKETSGRFSVVTYKKMFYSTSEDFAGVYAAVYENNQEIHSFNRNIQYWAHFTDGSWDYMGNYMEDANNRYSINEISAIDKIKVRIWL